MSVEIYELGTGDDYSHEIHSLLETLHLVREHVDAQELGEDRGQDRAGATA